MQLIAFLFRGKDILILEYFGIHNIRKLTSRVITL